MSETVKKHRSKQPKPHSPAPKRQSRQEAEEARQQRREDSRQAIETHIQNEWTPKFRRVTATREEVQPDGTTKTIRYVKRQPHPGWNPQEIITTLLGRPPTSADFPQIAAALSTSLRPESQLTQLAQLAINEALGEFFDTEDPSFLFLIIERFGPKALLDVRMNAVVESWWLMLLASDIPLERQQTARKHLKQLGESFLHVGPGNTKRLTEEEEKAIIEECKKWLPICQRLNTAFKKLWEIPEYRSSKLYRKEARGRLAEKYSIEVSGVEAIEYALQNRDTPWNAMLRMAARQPRFHGVDVKTVEALYPKQVGTTKAAATGSGSS